MLRTCCTIAGIVMLACSGPSPQRPIEPAPRATAALAPPIAARRPYEVSSPHGSRSDPYYWLRDDTRKDPAVLAYLEAENAHARAVLGPHQQLENTLYAEMRARIKEDDVSVPTFEEGYWYYQRFEAGKQHPIHARRKATMEAAEEILLDGNQLAAGHGYYNIASYEVSRDGALLAWADDTVGRNQYVLHVKNLATGALLPATASNIAPSLAWAADNKTLFYTGQDPVTLREDRVFRHTLGGPHELVFLEKDPSYYVGVKTSKSRRYIVIELDSTTSSEARLVDADQPRTPPRVFVARSKDHLYEVDHVANRFVMRTNADAKNFRLVEIAPGKAASRNAWKDLIAHRDDVLVEDFALYKRFIAASIRSGGLRKVQVLPAGRPAFVLDAQDPTYAMSVVDTPDPEATHVRYTYDAMPTPTSVFELDVATKERKLLREQPVPTYDASKYASEYVHATAPDGTKVPISLVYRKDTPRDGSAPVLVYGYGAYGSSIEPRFDDERVSLLDRNWVFAIAHVRGGEEMGRQWYEDGKLLAKSNTFTDFIAATEYLVANKYAARDQVFAMGGSAGGLLMGVIANARPDLYRGIVAFVPFVDAVTTMLDETIPLTTNEFEEWGNPKDKAAYDYILSYSPYDNVKPQRYPAMYVRTGLWDSQVQYYEPAKWVARLRATKTDDNLLVLETDMTAGHGGPSGRFDKLREIARAYTFMLVVRASRK